MYIAYRDKEGDEKGIAGAVTPDLIRGRNDKVMDGRNNPVRDYRSVEMINTTPTLHSVGNAANKGRVANLRLAKFGERYNILPSDANLRLAFYAVVLLVAGFVFVSCANEEVRKQKEFEKLFNQGFDYFHQDEYQKAFECLDKCIEIDSSYVELYANRGTMKMYLNDTIGAKQDYEKALTMDACSRFSLLGLAEIYDSYQEHKQAVCFYERLITCDSTFFATYINYGISCYEVGDYSTSLVQFSKYIKYIPEDPEPYEYIGKIYQQLGDSLTGEKFLNKADNVKKGGWDKSKSIIVIE
jgi:tetratricopeptide (TPR) repeat protein